MDPRFQAHNTHLEEPHLFQELDPLLRRLGKQTLVHRSALLGQLPRAQPGIYTVCGGRQVGKTTLLKQFMADLLEDGHEPRSLAYFSGELIDDHHSLVLLLTGHLSEGSGTAVRHVFVDEVTYIKNWDRGVKYLADAGMLDDVVLVLTGSDLVVLREATASLPGRRGRADRVEFHLHPLNFHEYVRLKGAFDTAEFFDLCDPGRSPSPSLVARLFEQFDAFLIHGGFLTAINDVAGRDGIAPATFSIYCDWIRGDVLKRGKREQYLREVLEAIVKRMGSQITWNNLARDLSIDHPKTVADYVGLLESMDAVYIQAALREDKLTGSPKKARKVMFTDPFIFHAVRSWLHPRQSPFEQQVVPYLEDPENQARLAEACAVSLYRRHFPTFYIKAAGEVDIAYVHEGRFWPVEVKWTGQLRPSAVKQISKYPNARILDRSHEPRRLLGIPTEPLPLALLRLDATGS